MKKIIYCSLIIILALVVGFSWNKTEKADAVAGQLPATFATSSTVTVTAGALVTAFATSTNDCVSRVITTNAEPIRLDFSDIDGFTLSSAVGHTQLASTTVAYDGSVYGCHRWQATNAGPSANTATFQVTQYR